MRRRTASLVVTTATMLLGLAAGPVGSASAQCSTLLQCVQERVDETVGDTVELVDALRRDVESRVNGRSLVCVLQGRWYTTGTRVSNWPAQQIYDGSGSGTADCVAHADAQKVRRGTFELTGVSAYMVSAGVENDQQRVLGTFSSGDLPLSSKPNAGRIVLGADVYTLRWLWGFHALNQGGAWIEPNSGARRLLAGVTTLLPARTLDPSGGSDLFIDAVWALQPVADDPNS